MDYNSLNGDFVHKCMEAIGFGKFHVLMLMSFGIRCLVRGSSNSMLSILQPYLRCHMKLSMFTASWIGTVLAIGRLLGAIPIGRMADRFGRRRSMFCLFSLHMLLSLLNALSSSYAMILITRASIGLVFEAVMLVYTYGMELLPIKKRNYLAVIDGFYGLGLLFASASAMGILGTVNWRWYVLVNETIPMAICVLLVAILPESPRYSFSQGHIQEAVKSLEKVAAINGVDWRKVVYESDINIKDVSPMSASLKQHRSLPKNELLSLTTNEKSVPHQDEGSRASLGRGNKSSKDTLLPQSDEMRDNELKASAGATAHMAPSTDLPKLELYKRIVILACLRFAVQVVEGLILFGSMQFKTVSSKIACDSCTANMNYNFLITYALASETGFLLSFILSGKYNRRFALGVVFLCRALIVTPFYFGIKQWAKILFFFMAAFFQFSSFVVVNIYGSEVIPTSHRALATGIENTVGNIGLFIGDFFALYLIHTNYYAVLAVLQGLTIFMIFIITVFVIDSKNVPLSDS